MLARKSGLRDKTQAPHPEGDDSVLSLLEVAKWLIPSVAGLFALIGYVVRSAHTSLIGREIDAGLTAGFAGAAADFFYGLPSLTADTVLDALADLNPFVFAGHESALLALVIVASLAWFASVRLCDDGKFARAISFIPECALVLILLFKLALLDAPLWGLQGLLFEADRPATEFAVKEWETDASVLRKGGLRAFVDGRTMCLYESIRRSRLPDSSLTAHAATSARCPDAARDPSAVRGEFMARLTACGVVAVLALHLLLKRRWSSAVLGMAALASLLTLPYAYGKLAVTTQMEVGRVLLSEDLAQVAKLPTGQPVESRDASRAEVVRAVDAMVLSRQGGHIDFLVKLQGGCPKPRDGSKARTYEVGRLWSVPESKVLSIREIYRQDVLTWKLQNSQGCPQEREQGGSNRTPLLPKDKR